MSLVVDTCDSPCYSGEDVSDGELSNAESSDSFEDQHVSIKLLNHNNNNNNNKTIFKEEAAIT